VGAPLDLSRAHGKQRLRSVQRLDLALFVDAQNQRAFGRRQVQADNIAHLLDKQGVGGKLERFGAMGLKWPERTPGDDARSCPGDKTRTEKR
jgi:hypothetical protein